LSVQFGQLEDREEFLQRLPALFHEGDGKICESLILDPLPIIVRARADKNLHSRTSSRTSMLQAMDSKISIIIQ
jgi:hypothetical protein